MLLTPQVEMHIYWVQKLLFYFSLKNLPNHLREVLQDQQLLNQSYKNLSTLEFFKI